MSLLTTLQNAVDTAFAAVGDLACDAVLTRAVKGSYDPATGTVASEDIAVDYTAVVQGAIKGHDDNLQGRALSIMLKAGPSVVPLTGDQLRLGNSEYVIDSVEELKPDGQNVLIYTVKVQA